MPRVSSQLLCQIYALLLLLAAAIMSGLSYLPLTLLLLLIALFTTLRPQSARLNIVVNMSMIFLAPLVLTPLLARLTALPPDATQIIAVALIIPVIYLLDDNLRVNTRQTPVFVKGKGGRHTTDVFVALLVSAVAMMLIAVVVNSLALLFTGIAFVTYLLCVLIWMLFAIPCLPLAADPINKRIIADTTANISLYIINKASTKLHSCLSPTVSWVRVTPPQVTLNGGKTKLDIGFTPPLSGQSRPQLLASSLDPRGFIQINQSLEPLQLHVIPRAKYAEWLARKYLEQAGSGMISAAVFPQAVIKTRRGIEYRESRTYQPGDALRDIDWKHSLKLSQIIVKEYREANEQVAIIAVNLSAADAEAADKVAFNLITAALTLARENIPTALAAYNHQSVVLSTPVIEPLNMLQQALSLVREITTVKFDGRHLEPTDIAKIRRNINKLKQTESEPARRLLDVFNFEHRSIEEAARNNPATLALTRTTRQVRPPAMILLVSQLNHDAEALLVTAEKLAKRKFTTVPVDGS